jgi:hypothetical protein
LKCKYPGNSEFPGYLGGLLLDAQPAPVRDAFNYCLALMMVEAGKMRLVETIPGESGEVCTLEQRQGKPSAQRVRRRTTSKRRR